MSIKYEKINVKEFTKKLNIVENINENSDKEIIDNAYEKLINSKNKFLILEDKNTNYVLTKEKSIFKIENEDKFVKKFEQDEYYKTRCLDEIEKKRFIHDYEKEVEKALIEFWNDITKNKNEMIHENTCGYIFGCVAVRIGSTNSFITTIRGKKDLKEYTIVTDVDNLKKEVKVYEKKAALNAPLLYNIFKQNKNVKKIIHINHKYTNDITLEYEFPGTKKDSLRNINTSFNIKYHGFFKLYNEKNEKI